jgi:hypothetical protein
VSFFLEKNNFLIGISIDGLKKFTINTGVVKIGREVMICRKNG